MHRFAILLFLSLTAFIGACKKDGDEPLLMDKTCIEGWTNTSGGSEIYYERCPHNLAKCDISIKIYMNVYGYWNEGPGKLTIRNIENGKVVEEFSREQLIYRHRFQITMSYNKIHKYTHEITLELPSESCTVNNELYRSTFTFDIPCDSFIDFSFDICKPED